MTSWAEMTLADRLREIVTRHDAALWTTSARTATMLEAADELYAEAWRTRPEPAPSGETPRLAALRTVTEDVCYGRLG